MNYLTYGDKNNKSVVLIHGMAKIYTYLFVFFSEWLKKGHKIPKFVYDKIYDSMFGKNNREISNYAGKAVFIYGEHEPYARKGAKRLKSYMPSLEIKELKDMGHGQLLHSYPKMWAHEILKNRFMICYPPKTVQQHIC